jgi:thymidylate synthase (FAD)
LEQAEATFYLRLPIFVARQLVRHRTANLNEYSARYSELSDDYYVPGPEYLARQSTSNKQGRGGEPFTDAEKAEITNIMVESQETSVNAYRKLLDMGVSRELARIPTSVGIYTEMYWKCDLHNLMHFFKLRTDAHAQQEIRDVANAMFACVEPYFPLAFDAWEDFNRDAYTLSRAEIRLLGNLLNRHDGETMVWGECPRDMSEREYSDFKFFINTLRMRESG